MLIVKRFYTKACQKYMKINFLAVKFVYAVFEGMPKTLSKFESSCEKFLDLPMVQIRELLLVSKNHSTK